MSAVPTARRRALRSAPVLGALTGLALAVSAAPAASPPAVISTPAVISATVAPAELTIGASASVAGTISEAGNPVAGAALALQADGYPFGEYVTVARQGSGADGGFAFTGLALDRDTRLRVVLESSPTTVSETLPVIVDPGVAVSSRTLGPGKTRLSIRVAHTVHAGSAAASVAWFVAAKGAHVFHRAVSTPMREIAPGVSYAETVIDPPAEHFAYRVCLNSGWEHAMGARAEHGRCPFETDGKGRGIPLASYPSPDAIAAATRYLDGRSGRTSFAVVDSKGRLSGTRLREHFETASVVKVMMLAAYLQMRSAQHRGLSSSDDALLYPMIHESNNESASAVFGIVGSGAVSRIARESGMGDYAPGVGWWAFTQTSAADQARFFFALDRLIPRQFYAYARGLMAGIEPSQSWGVPPVARPRWQVFFKTGALPSQGLFNEVARLERPGVTFTIAVFTDGDPSMEYGEQTIEGVAAILLAHTP